MDIWYVHVKYNGLLLRNSFLEKPICLNARNNSIAAEVRVLRSEYLSISSRYQSVLVRSMGNKNSGDSNSSNSNSSSSSSGNSGNSKAGDDLKRKNPPESNKSGETDSPNSHHKPLDWREFRSLLCIHEQAENGDSVNNQDKMIAGSKSLPLKWAHPISTPENGSLLVATGKLDGVLTFERSVVLLLRSGTKNPQEGPFGVVINQPLHKKMKHMNPTNAELETTFAECSLHFGGPLDASMFLLRDDGISSRLSGLEEVIPGIYFGSRKCLIEASQLVKKGRVRPQDFRFFMGYAGWQMEQLIEEIESEYWYVAACSANLIFEGAQNASSSYGLWEEVLQLMGGQYSELSCKPKQDI